MREAVKQPASWGGQVILALPSNEAFVPSLTAPETFIASLPTAHALSSWSVASNTAPAVTTAEALYESRLSSLCRFDTPLSVSPWVSRRGRPALPEACCEPVRPEPARRLKLLAWLRLASSGEPQGAAQLGNREDVPRQAGSRLSSQTLGGTEGRHCHARSSYTAGEWASSSCFAKHRSPRAFVQRT